MTKGLLWLQWSCMITAVSLKQWLLLCNACERKSLRAESAHVPATSKDRMQAQTLQACRGRLRHPTHGRLKGNNVPS